MPPADKKWVKGESCVSTTYWFFKVDIESVKTAASAYVPVDCKFLELNKKLQESPEELNAKNAEDSAWLIKVTVTKEDQLKDLMTKAQYDKFLESEKGHW